MNYTKNFLIFSSIFIILCLFISSVNSSEDSSLRDIRYLAENGTDQPASDNTTVKKINCTEEIDRCYISHMVCEDETLKVNCTCKSDDYYENYDLYITDARYCEIEKKKQLTAFLLELFVGFGAGHFYRHHYLMASLKLVAFFIGIYLICLFPLAAKGVTECCDNDCVVIIVSIFFYFYALGLAFWYIWDLVYFGKNKYPDCSHGDNCIDLKPW